MRPALALSFLVSLPLLHCTSAETDDGSGGADRTATHATGVTIATGTGGAGGGDLGCPAGSHEIEGGGCEATFLGYTEGPALLEARDHHVTFVYETPSKQAFLYVLGGMVNQSSSLKSMERATIAADGTVGPWESFGQMPRAMVGHAFARVDDAFLMSGGFSGANKTEVVRLADDGTIASWTSGPPMVVGRAHHMMVAHEKRVYAIGGIRSGDNTPSVEMTTYDGQGFAAWTETTPLPAKRSHHAVVATDEGIFVMGGISGDPAGVYDELDDVLYASFQPDGSLSAWTPAGTLPDVLSVFSGFAHAGYVYVMGGLTGFGFRAETRRAPILAGGTLGAWEDLAPLPQKRGHVHQIPRYKDVFFHVGGYAGTSQDEVYIGRLQ